MGHHKSFPFSGYLLEGRLVLVHENLELKNLSTLDIEKVQTLSELDTDIPTPKHTLLDANDFITKMRAVGGEKGLC